MAIIVATTCLHNLARQRNDPLPDPIDGPIMDNNAFPELPNPVEANFRGNVFRQAFIIQHF